MYVLLNRENIVDDILDNLRYIKLQSSNGIVVACSEEEGTGIIGSDCDTHYVLIQADTIPSNVTPNLYKFDNETQSFVYRYSLDEAKELKQEKNKLLFAEYLASHPLTWTDGKEYGVTMEDQSEISLNLSQYQIAVQAGVESPTLEWHARHEECQPWTLENLVALSMSISAAVYPMYRKMQQYKISIYGATSLEELEQVELDYAD